MTIEYLQDIGFIYNSHKIKWNDSRISIRGIFENKHKEDDRVIDMAEFFDGDESMNLYPKRDIYKNIHSDSDMLFLNYDQNDKLIELEIHFGYDILVENIRLEFGNRISDYLELFVQKGIEYSKLDGGDYLIRRLNMTIADSRTMGGEGQGLSYFYGTADICHLIK